MSLPTHTWRRSPGHTVDRRCPTHPSQPGTSTALPLVLPLHQSPTQAAEAAVALAVATRHAVGQAGEAAAVVVVVGEVTVAVAVQAASGVAQVHEVAAQGVCALPATPAPCRPWAPSMPLALEEAAKAHELA